AVRLGRLRRAGADREGPADGGVLRGGGRGAGRRQDGGEPDQRPGLPGAGRPRGGDRRVPGAGGRVRPVPEGDGVERSGPAAEGVRVHAGARLGRVGGEGGGRHPGRERVRRGDAAGGGGRGGGGEPEGGGRLQEGQGAGEDGDRRRRDAGEQGRPERRRPPARGRGVGEGMMGAGGSPGGN